VSAPLRPENQSVAAFDISMYPLNLIGINILCAQFHGSGQVDDYLLMGGWFPNIYDSLTNLKGIVHFGTQRGFARDSVWPKARRGQKLVPIPQDWVQIW